MKYKDSFKANTIKATTTITTTTTPPPPPTTTTSTRRVWKIMKYKVSLKKTVAKQQRQQQRKQQQQQQSWKRMKYKVDCSFLTSTNCIEPICHG